MSSFNPDGPVGTQLKQNLIQELRNRYSCGDDAGDIAEFIVILIASGKQHHEILAEVKEIADIRIDVPFIESIFREIERLEQEHKQQYETPQTEPEPAYVHGSSLTIVPDAPISASPANATTSNVTPPVVSAFPNAFPADYNGSAFPNAEAASSLPKGPKLLRSLPTGPKGISKDRSNKPKSFAMKNAANFTKAMNAGQKFVAKPSTGRCKEFPFCKTPNCEWAHPTKYCFAYPNCANPPGTCNYLHPEEDEELIAQLAKSKEEFAEKKKKEVQIQSATCKFGPNCTKDTCPFAHPTPANSSANISTLEWCPQGKQCINTECGFAHPPPPTAKPINLQEQAEIAFEQCKFGTACTNPKCLRRHATSKVMCRGGAGCRRLDCFFTHPIKEDCRFGKQCQKKGCLYQHPEGREIGSNTWSLEKDQWSGEATSDKSNRTFAEDQAMEQVVQQ